MILFPILAWEKKRLMLPLAVATVWVLWGLRSNYLLWDVYPISEFYDYHYLLINTPSPAPDYASKFNLPISLMVLSAVFEMAYREIFGSGKQPGNETARPQEYIQRIL